MAETPAVKRAREVLDAEIGMLKAHASTSVNPCDVAKLIAVTNEGVMKVLMEHVARGDQPRGVTCIGTGRVLFAFGCPPETICLVPRDVLVVVDLAKRQVTDIVDPYDSNGRSDRAHERFDIPAIARISSVRSPIVREQRSSGTIRSGAMAALGNAPHLHAMEKAFSAADSLSVTFTVPEMGVREVIDDQGNVFLFEGTSLQLTVPNAGRFRFSLRVSDPTHANETFTYTVSTGTNSKTFQTTLDGNGDVLDIIRVDVP
jgi:hypothetical protein